MRWAPAKQPNKVENFFITYRNYFHPLETASTAPRSKLVLAPPSKRTRVHSGALSGGRSTPPPTSHRAVIVPAPLGAANPAAPALRTSRRRGGAGRPWASWARELGGGCGGAGGAGAANPRAAHVRHVPASGPPPRAGSAGGAGGWVRR